MVALDNKSKEFPVKKVFKNLAAIFIFALSLNTVFAEDTETSYSDDFLLFDSETENFKKDKDGLYEWTGSFVLDTAEMLSENERLSLKEFLRDLNDTTGVQIAVLTIPTTDGENIHDLAVRYFDKWEIGQEGIDNGAILTVALNDRMNDITTGDGTEGILTDILCKKILDEVMKPAFQAGHYGEGIINAVNCMAGIIVQDDSINIQPETKKLIKKIKEEPKNLEWLALLLLIGGTVAFVFIIVKTNRLIEYASKKKSERETEKMKKRKLEAWLALPPEERERITREQQEKEAEKQRKIEEKEKAWKSLSAAQRKRIMRNRKTKNKKSSNSRSSYERDSDSYSSSSYSSSSSSYRSSSSSSSGSYRSGGGGHTSGGGASSSW